MSIRRFGPTIGLVAALVDPTPSPLAAAPSDGGGHAADRLLSSVEEAALRELLAEALERNPDLAVARSAAEAAARGAPAAGGLPRPTATVTGFLAPPETRVGAQRLALAVAQPLPWRGTRGARAEAAARAAEALAWEVEARRLGLATEVRRLAYELSFVARQRGIVETFHDHLIQHEEIARARYSTGVGTSLGVVKLQAEITGVEAELLGIEIRRSELAARLNALRDRAATAPVPEVALTAPAGDPVDLEPLLARARARRPELAAARARTAEAKAMVRLAELATRPDFRVGLTYALVEPRDDLAGGGPAPRGDGDDVFGLQGGLTLPVWRKSLAARLDGATARVRSAREAEHRAASEIETRVGDLVARVRPVERRLRLLEEVMVVQAEEARDAATAGYVAGTLSALDLLDAEHVLFDAQTSALRARADYAIAVARLEGAVGAPLASPGEGGGPPEGADLPEGVER